MTPQNEQQQNQNPIQPIGGKETVREQDKIMLILSYLGILSLIPLLTVKDSDYVKFHAKQGLVLFGFGVITVLLNMIPFVGTVIYCVGVLGLFVLTIMGIVKALGGERWRIPVVSDIAQKINM